MGASSVNDLTAGDIMQRDLIVAHMGDSLKEAMDLMTENHVTGLPVVDSKSRCVGVISATDILSYEQEHSEFTSEANSDMARHFDMDTQRWESVRVTSFALEEFADVKVDAVMSRDLVGVGRDMPVREVAQKMIDASIHRVMELDENQRL